MALTEKGEPAVIDTDTWGVVTKHFSLKALQKFEWVFKIVNLRGSGCVSFSEMEDFAYGIGITFKGSQLYKYFSSCSDDGEMDLAQFLHFIFSLQTNGFTQEAQMIVEHAELQYVEHAGESDSDLSAEDDEENRLLRAANQAKRAEKLASAKADALENNDPRHLQPFFPLLYAKYRPLSEGDDPVVEGGLMELVHTLAEFNYDAKAVEEKMDAMVAELQGIREQVNAARAKYKDVFSEEQLNKFIKQFQSVDDDGSGEISKEELWAIFDKIGMKVSPEKLDYLFTQIDVDGSGFVDLDEFLLMMQKIEEGNDSEMARLLAQAALKAEKLKKQEEQNKRESRAKEAARRAAVFRKFTKAQVSMFQDQFNICDADGSGEIDFDEMRAMLKGLGMEVDAEVLRRLMRSIDSDGNGNLSFTEFLEMMSAGKNGEMAGIFNQITNRQASMNQERRLKLKREQQRMIKKKEEEKRLKAAKAAMKAWAVKQLSAKEIKGLEKGFKAIDIDNDETLTEDELSQLLQLLRINMTAEKLHEMFKEVDIDNSGALDFAEFLVLAAKAKDMGGKHAKAFSVIVNAQSRAQESRAVRNQLSKLAEKKVKEKLNVSLQREAMAASRAVKHTKENATKRKQNNQKRAKKIEMRQAAITDKNEQVLAQSEKRLADKTKDHKKRYAKSQKERKKEQDRVARSRRERSQQARAKAELLKN